MADDPLDPLKEQKKLKRLVDDAVGGSARKLIEEDLKRRKFIDDAMGSSARRFFEEEQRHQRLLDQSMGGSVQRFFEDEQKRRKLFDPSAIGKAAQGMITAQKEQARALSTYKSDAIQKYLEADNARRKAFDVGSLASARAFQDNMASTVATLIDPFSKLSKQMRELGVLDRIAEQQSALVRASAGINSQIEAASRAMRGVIPNAREISSSLGVQSALAQQMRRISEQVAQLDGAMHTGGIRESAVWETMRDTYGFSNEMSVSQAFLEIGTKLDEPSEEGKSFGFYDAWRLVEFLWLVLSVYAMIAGWGDYTEQDRARDEATANAVERIEIRQHMNEVEAAIAEASALAEMNRINAMPRAFVREAANVRVAPEQNAKRIARIAANTMLGINERNGRWLRVIYADPLTEELAEGWVWGGSVELLASN
jgi:hypothetical protein